MKAAGEFREGLAAMAQVIQEGLTHAELRDKILHQGGIEFVMRAVTHAIGNPNDSIYILEKLDFGQRCLENWMSEDNSSKRTGHLETSKPRS